jgi:hypothetical protein
VCSRILTTALAVTGFITIAGQHTTTTTVIHHHTPESPPTPPPPPPPPPPRVDTVEDFQAAFTCSNVQQGSPQGWLIGGAKLYGGPPNGMTITDGPVTWQPQLLLRHGQAAYVPYADCSQVQGRLQDLGVTAVTGPLVNGAYRVRYFTTQTEQQSAALQMYFIRSEPPDQIESHALIGNTGWCLIDNTGPCESY